MGRGKLRRYGVYRLPDETQVVAVPRPDGCHLYFLSDWGGRLSPSGTYIVYPSGLIRREGKLTGWHSKDLQDTGQTLGYGGRK